MSWERRALAFLSLFFLLIFVATRPPAHELRVDLEGSSSTTVTADRATLSLKISHEGSKQDRVAENVRQTTDDILSLLRPLTLAPNKTLTTDAFKNTSGTTDLPPLATLSVNTLSFNSRPVDGLLGESTKYQSSIDITAVFRSLAPPDPAPGATLNTSADFKHLSLVLPSMLKAKNTRLTSFEWSLSEDRLATLQSQTRQNAMADCLRRVQDFIAPMHLSHPRIRSDRIREYTPARARPSGRISNRGYDEYYSDGGSVLMSVNDEIDDHGLAGQTHRAYEIEREGTAAFGLEAQRIEIASQVWADWKISERSVVAWLLGFVV